MAGVHWLPCVQGLPEPADLAVHIAETVNASDDVDEPARTFRTSHVVTAGDNATFYLTVVERNGIEQRFEVTVRATP
jgi:predicted phage gp36 major capsid-like protein